MRKLVVAVSVLIIYGSLYPFHFDLASFDPDMLPALFDFRPGRVGRGDLLANIVLFVPFGFFAMQAAEHRTRWTTWLIILVAGFILAHALQIAQLVIPGRVPSAGDTLLNMVGCALGCLLGTLRMPRLSAANISTGPLPVPTILALFLLLWNLRPFVPSIDLQLLIDNIKSLVESPIPHPLWTFQGAVTWLVIFHFLDSEEPRLIPEKRYPLIVFITLALGFFIVGGSVNTDRIAGALIALPIWRVVRRLPRPPLLSILTFLLIVGISFEPFELRGTASRFNWVPFSGALNGSLLINVLATTKKVLLYGSLIWLLVQCRVRLSVATIAVSAFLLVSEQLQVYFAGRTPEITDPLLALMAGMGFRFWEDFRLKSREGSGPMAAEPRGIGVAHPVRNDDNVAIGAATCEENGPNVVTQSQPPSDNQELVINLRRSQASFLSHLADATDLEIGGVCGRLIALAARPEADWRQDVLFGDPVRSALQALNRIPADNHWTQVELQLDQSALELLDSLPERASSSRSQTLRHLVADCMEKSGVRPPRRRHRRAGWRRRWRRLRKSPPLIIGIAAAVALVTVVLVFALRDTHPTQSGPAWAGNRASLILDPHTHTRYSDGKLTPAELVAMAVDEGCDALVISDHSDTSGTVSDSQLDEMEKLRERYPHLLLFNGVELNMPSYGQREHATLMASPSVAGATLREFRDLAENSPVAADTDTRSGRADNPLLERIADHKARFGDLLVFYSHPARKDPDVWENFEDLSRWNAQGPVFLAVEGAPGHQNAKVIGSYQAPLFTEDRWDPVVAEVGGVWDQLLSHGRDVWGALASSDYHNDNLDKPPCAFSRTHLIVPERSYRGVLVALESGTFWADHGRILDQLWFSVHVDGLERSAAYPGATVHLTGREEEASLALSIERGPGSLGQPLVAEFIGSCRLGAAESLARLRIAPEENAVAASMPLLQGGRDGESCTVRARVRLERDGETDYLAYTNHIRLVLD